MVRCIFYECQHPVVQHGSSKCIVHHSRTPCSTPKCRNQAYARGRCVRHGARKYCLMEGCKHYRRAGGYCARHTTVLRMKSLALMPPTTPQKNQDENNTSLVSSASATPLDAEWTAMQAFLIELNFALLTSEDNVGMDSKTILTTW
ncbi:hypothetical protein H257_16451 [Aphanomyces astaci]|uniref:Uncharacterized protein n=1 Tax=Aphanomyces astaci TaxID=112090 RepID=W4FIL9_APHAT|nr:hypothetical protein H257_16451 [Aphanomyces astaci]ETV67367.1 hypothetical protein H257_16451 [Aphanomyces astaci]|eukprot:XP_009843182.1 hypothetical protein H257_16451 [Aphanomyces astaci]